MKIDNKYIRDGRAPKPKKEITSKIMSLIKAKNTKPELILRKALRKEKLLDYKLHNKDLSGKPDISYPKKKIAIFIHGCFWHRCPYCRLNLPKTHLKFWKNKFKKNVIRDIKNIRQLKDKNWKVLTVWECQIKNNLQRCISRLKRMVENV